MTATEDRIRDLMTALDALLDAHPGDLTRVEDQVTFWHDRAVNDGGIAPARAELLSSVVTDALRQVGEARSGCRGLRLTWPSGTRITLTWEPPEAVDESFGEMALDLVRHALGNHSEPSTND